MDKQKTLTDKGQTKQWRKENLKHLKLLHTKTIKDLSTR